MNIHAMNSSCDLREYTPFAFHFAVDYKKIRIHFREMETYKAKIHSLAPKNEHLRITQIH